MPAKVAMLSGALLSPNNCMKNILITPMRGWQQKYPSHGFEKRRKQNADAEQAHGQSFVANIGALDEPGEQ